LLAGGLFLPSEATDARDLTFEDRVKAQEAIERVYYSHQIGTTRPFEEAVTRAVLVHKVRTYLKESLALETIWRKPITAEALERELERIARRTRMPERLHELFAALGNDSLLIQECLARPLLVGRLARSFFSSDQTLHGDERRAAGDLRERLIRGEVDPARAYPGRTVTRFTRVEPGEADSAAQRDASRLELSPEDFRSLATRFPGQVGVIGSIAETPDAFQIPVVLDRNPDSLLVATFTIPKESWEGWWTKIESGLGEDSVEAVAIHTLLPDLAPQRTGVSSCAVDDQWLDGTWDDVPDARYGHTAVWTGSLMLVWGGDEQVSGGRYDPATDTWEPITRLNAPSPRDGHTAVWTGSVMIVWGGTYGYQLNTGGRYDPQTDTWTPTSTLNAPMARDRHTAIWTGREMAIWGGRFIDPTTSRIFDLNTGGTYDPGTDRWSATPTLNAPTGRSLHASVWTGSLMVVWGGVGDSGTPVSTGGRYDPVAAAWTPTSTVNAPTARTEHTAIWTGSRMVVWGGRPFTSTGGRYDPATDTWLATSLVNAPAGVANHSAAWTGSEMVIWGGFNGSATNSGRGYDPISDIWRTVSLANAPTGRYGHTAVWTGSLMVVWGGQGDGGNENTGGRYDPLTDTWTPTFTGNPASVRSNPTAIWTGTQMVVWGGLDFRSTAVATGGRYDPATDSWQPTTMMNAPSARYLHTAVWDGSDMVIWGGYPGPTNTGGLYDPLTDSWKPTSMTNAPSALYDHTAIWTGSQMIVWGGYTVGGVVTNSGGRYNPASDRWQSVSSLNAPSPRTLQGAVWTGAVMVVWGGYTGSSWTNTGGRYDPTTDTWNSTAPTGAPVPLGLPSVVWTGRVVIVWVFSNTNSTAGGRYSPETDSWLPMSATNAPIGRTGDVVVWTGDLMVIWGGNANNTSTDTGGRYDPIADVWMSTTVVRSPTPRYAATGIWTGNFMLVFGGYNVVPLNSGGRYCSCKASIYHPDADGDGYGDPSVSIQSCGQPAGHVLDNTDCNDADSGAWGTPSEVRDLLFTDTASLIWAPPAFQGATADVYDVLRSGSPADFVTSTACVASDITSAAATDFDSPATGAAFFYLVRAQDSCPSGLGPLGATSDGTPRSGRACP